jgi:hypothetical protein
LAAIAVLLMLAVVLQHYWPDAITTMEPIGVVTHVDGNVQQVLREDTQRLPAALRGYVQAGERYETESASTLMLSLLGPTQVKLKEHTRIQVIDERRLRVEEGEIWVDVGNDGRLFKIATPSGRITVFGTAFGVKVDMAQDSVMTVAVQRGEVQVEGDEEFELVRPGHLVRVVNREPAKPEEADVDAVVAWADSIVEDRSARELFQNKVLARSETTELRGNSGFFIDTTEGGRDRAVSAIILRWTPDKRASGHASYDMFVYNNDWQPLFRDHIPGRVFADKSRNSCKIPVPGGPITGTKHLIIILVPVHEDGSAETALAVSAVAL